MLAGLRSSASLAGAECLLVIDPEVLHGFNPAALDASIRRAAP